MYNDANETMIRHINIETCEMAFDDVFVRIDPLILSFFICGALNVPTPVPVSIPVPVLIPVPVPGPTVWSILHCKPKKIRNEDIMATIGIKAC